MDVSQMYWEEYDNQNSSDFDYVGYIDLSGNEVVSPVGSNLAQQVAEIYRCNGKNTVVKVYKDQAVLV